MVDASNPVLRCEGLRKRFGTRTAVEGVSFEIGAGETYGLLGPNGAGKTTTISMICGLLAADEVSPSAPYRSGAGRRSRRGRRPGCRRQGSAPALRDRTAYIVGLVAPLVLAGLITLAFGRSGFQFEATYAVVDQDGGPIAQAFVGDALTDPGLAGAITLKAVGDREEAVRLARAGDVAAAIVVPAGYSAGALAGEPIALEVVRSADNRIGADVAVAIAQGFTAKVNAIRLSVVTAMATGAQGRSAEQVVADAAHVDPSVVLEEQGAERADVPASSRYAPGMGIFFMFFVVGWARGAWWRNADKARSPGSLPRRSGRCPCRPARPAPRS